MVRYFRINDPYRLFFGFLAFVLIQVPFWWGQQPVTESELLWRLAGERVAAGAVPYSGVFTGLSPLALYTYGGIHWLLGGSPLVYHGLAAVLAVWQAFLFSNLLLQQKAYNESSYVPGLVFFALLYACHEFTSLSPTLLALTFFMAALNLIFKHAELRAKHDEDILLIGLFMGLGSLFYLPLAGLIIPVLLSFALFTATVPRRYLLICLGLLLPWALAALVFHAAGHGQALWAFFQFVLWGGQRKMDAMQLWQLLPFVVPGLLVALWGVIIMLRQRRYVNYQVRLQQMMFLLMLTAITIWLINPHRSPYHLVLLLPFLAFFISHLLLLLRRAFFVEAVFLLLLAANLTVNWTFHTSKGPLAELWGRVHTYADETPFDAYVEDKTVLFLGPGLDVYRNSHGGHSFLEWPWAVDYFTEPFTEEQQALIVTRMQGNLPAVIIDPQHRLPPLLEASPFLQRRYQRVGALPMYQVHTLAETP